MRGRIALVVVGLTLAAVPADAEGVADRNETWLLGQALAHGWPDGPALRAQVREAAAMAGPLDLAALHGPRAEGVRPDFPVHLGEIWYDCVRIFLGNNCDVQSVGIGFACAAVPAHWALYLWVGGTVLATVPPGTLILWTESHLGLSPLTVDTEGGTFAGSLCVQQFGFLTVVAGTVVFVEDV